MKKEARLSGGETVEYDNLANAVLYYKRAVEEKRDPTREMRDIILHIQMGKLDPGVVYSAIEPLIKRDYRMPSKYKTEVVTAGYYSD